MTDQLQPGTVRPKRLDARRNYEQILRVASQAIEEHGADTSLREIARKAGIGLGTLYRHFPTRDALIETLMREKLNGFSTRVRAARSSPDPGEALATCIRDYLAGVMVYKGIAFTFMGAFKDPASALHASCAAAQEELEALLQRAQAGGRIRPDVTVKELFALVNGLAWVFDQGTLAPEQGKVLVDVVVEGLRNRIPGTKP